MLNGSLFGCVTAVKIGNAVVERRKDAWWIQDFIDGFWWVFVYNLVEVCDWSGF